MIPPTSLRKPLQSSLILGLLVLFGLLPAGGAVCLPFLNGLHIHLGWLTPTGESTPALTVFTHSEHAAIGADAHDGGSSPDEANHLQSGHPVPNVSVITWPTPSEFLVVLARFWALPLLTLWWLRLISPLAPHPWRRVVQTPPPRPAYASHFATA